MSDDWETTLRPCGLCHEWLPIDRFHRRGAGYIVWCKACRKVWDAAYHARNRVHLIAQKRRRAEELVAAMRELKGQPCVDCGGTFHPAAMTFDHLPGTTKRQDVATLAGRGLTRALRVELEKCELVCANCHAVRTFDRREEAKKAA